MFIYKPLKLKTALAVITIVCSFQNNGLNNFLPCLFNKNTFLLFFFFSSDIGVELIF